MARKKATDVSGVEDPNNVWLQRWLRQKRPEISNRESPVERALTKPEPEMDSWAHALAYFMSAPFGTFPDEKQFARSPIVQRALAHHEAVHAAFAGKKSRARKPAKPNPPAIEAQIQKLSAADAAQLCKDIEDAKENDNEATD